MGRAPMRPRAILLSKRANVTYVEFARVLVKDDRVVYLTETGEDVDQFFNIPYRNAAFVLLGKGTSITDAAMRKLAEAQVVVGFCGSGGSPLTQVADAVYCAGQSEYRPTEYMQRWMRMWLDESHRLLAAKCFQACRVRMVASEWSSNPALQQAGILVPDKAIKRFESALHAVARTEELMAAEAVFARSLYASIAEGYRLDFRREEGKRSRATVADCVNGLIDHGNYIAYGYAAVALYALGISYALPVLHGKTRRGALVFDVADIFKDAIVLPLAFSYGAAGAADSEFRAALIDKCQTAGMIDLLIETIQEAAVKKLS